MSRSKQRFGGFVVALAALVAVTAVARLRADDPKPDGPKPDGPPPRIQLAILLDTSNSMDGLINQARAHLWKVVGQFGEARRDGVRPTLEVALFEYGNNSLSVRDGYIRMVVPLTTDLDKVSDELFKLKTNGGEEYCGQVIDVATRTLAWSDSPRDMKCIFIAGNEPFTQGPVDYHVSCRAAAHKNITVSTIHCGSYEEGARTGWRDGALLADGSYMAINQDRQVADVAAPQDKKLAELSGQLNQTYVAYGSATRRNEFQGRQAAQDKNAEHSAPSAASARAGFKASRHYSNAEWDLGDAVREGKVKLEMLKDEELPEELRKIAPADRKAFVEKRLKERDELQSRIKALAAEREDFLAKARKADSGKDGESLDEAVMKATREQAAKRNFKLK